MPLCSAIKIVLGAPYRALSNQRGTFSLSRWQDRYPRRALVVYKYLSAATTRFAVLKLHPKKSRQQPELHGCKESTAHGICLYAHGHVWTFIQPKSRAYYDCWLGRRHSACRTHFLHFLSTHFCYCSRAITIPP